MFENQKYHTQIYLSYPSTLLVLQLYSIGTLSRTMYYQVFLQTHLFSISQIYSTTQYVVYNLQGDSFVQKLGNFLHSIFALSPIPICDSLHRRKKGLIKETKNYFTYTPKKGYIADIVTYYFSSASPTLSLRWTICQVICTLYCRPTVFVH